MSCLKLRNKVDNKSEQQIHQRINLRKKFQVDLLFFKLIFHEKHSLGAHFLDKLVEL